MSTLLKMFGPWPGFTVAINVRRYAIADLVKVDDARVGPRLRLEDPPRDAPRDHVLQQRRQRLHLLLRQNTRWLPLPTRPKEAGVLPTHTIDCSEGDGMKRATWPWAHAWTWPWVQASCGTHVVAAAKLDGHAAVALAPLGRSRVCARAKAARRAEFAEPLHKLEQVPLLPGCENVTVQFEAV